MKNHTLFLLTIAALITLNMRSLSVFAEDNSLEDSVASTVSESNQAPANTKKITFDSSKCSEDPHGTTYIAIGKTVLRHAGDIYATLHKVSDYVFLVPPKPSEPAGCPGNPVQGYIYFLSAKDASNAADSQTEQYIILEKGEIKDEPIFNGTIGFDKACKNPAPMDESIPGFRGCSNPSCKDYTWYQATNYTTPAGRQLIFSCNNTPDIKCEKGYSQCSAAYMFNDDLRINYRFNVKALPILDAVKLDRKVRHVLSDEEIKDYRWNSSQQQK